MRTTIYLIAVLAAALLFADAADACSRCGLFNRRCRFQHRQAVVLKQVHQPAYQAPATTLNIVNNYPNALLAPQGDAHYGYSLRNAIQPLTSDFYGKQSARLLDHSQEILKLSAGMAVSETDHLEKLQLKALETQELAQYVEGIKAIRSGSSSVQQTLRLQLSGDGIKQGQSPTVATADDHRDCLNVFGNACARCHSGESAKGGLRLDDGITAAELEAMQEAIDSGKMPPDDGTAIRERAYVDQLRALIGS